MNFNAAKEMAESVYNFFFDGEYIISAKPSVRQKQLEQRKKRKRDALQVLASLVFVGLYIYDTYHPAGSLWRRVADILLCSFFAWDYVLGIKEAPDPGKYALSFDSIINVITFLPPLLEDFLPINTLIQSAVSLRLLRVLRVLRITLLVRQTRSFSGVTVSDAANARILNLLSTVLVLLFATASIIQAVEGLPWGDALYFVTTTLTTVGFGDIAPNTPLGKLAVFCMILFGVVYIPTQTSSLYSLLVNRRVRLGPLSSDSNRFPTVLVSTKLSDISSFNDFFSEFFHEVREKQIPPKLRMVALTNKPDYDFRAFQELNKERVTFCEGSVLSDSDLLRVKAERAGSCIILADKLAKDPEEEDLSILFQTWALKSYTKAPIGVQCLRRETKDRIAPFLDPSNNDVVVSAVETKYVLLALSALCPGASTLMGNLMRSSLPFEHVEGGYTRRPEDQWREDYMEGCTYEIYDTPSGELAGFTFEQAAEWLYRSSAVTLVGIQPEGRLYQVVINPLGCAIRREDTLIVMAQTSEEAYVAVNRPPSSAEFKKLISGDAEMQVRAFRTARKRSPMRRPERSTEGSTPMDDDVMTTGEFDFVKAPVDDGPKRGDLRRQAEEEAEGEERGEGAGSAKRAGGGSAGSGEHGAGREEGDARLSRGGDGQEEVDVMVTGEFDFVKVDPPAKPSGKGPAGAGAGGSGPKELEEEVAAAAAAGERGRLLSSPGVDDKDEWASVFATWEDSAVDASTWAAEARAADAAGGVGMMSFSSMEEDGTIAGMNDDPFKYNPDGEAAFERSAQRVEEVQGHIILAGAHEGMVEFVRELRGLEPSAVPVIVLAPKRPVPEIWRILTGLKNVFFIKGDANDYPLEPAAIKGARSFVYLAKRPTQDGAGEDDDPRLPGSSGLTARGRARAEVLADAEALLTCYNALQQEDEGANYIHMHTVVELNYTSSIRFLQPGLLYAAIRGHAMDDIQARLRQESPGSARPPSGSSASLAKMGSKVDRNVLWNIGSGKARDSWSMRSEREKAAHSVGLAEWQANTYYAAGRAVLPAVMDTFACQCFLRPATGQHILLDISSSMRQVVCPGELVGLTYGELFTFLVRSKSLLPMGLYRRRDGVSGVQHYVLTSPPPATVLQAGDRVFVLKPNGGEAAQASGFLQSPATPFSGARGLR